MSNTLQIPNAPRPSNLSTPSSSEVYSPLFLNPNRDIGLQGSSNNVSVNRSSSSFETTNAVVGVKGHYTPKINPTAIAAPGVDFTEGRFRVRRALLAYEHEQLLAEQEGSNNVGNSNNQEVMYLYNQEIDLQTRSKDGKFKLVFKMFDNKLDKIQSVYVKYHDLSKRKLM
jgi:hypothetical protein